MRDLRLSRIKSKTVIICGSSRSGTSWLAEAINSDETFRYIFEPLHPKHPLPNRPFKDVAHAPEPGEFPAYKAFFDPIIKGRINNEWVDRFATTRYTRKKLIKFIRANLAAAWLSRTYPKAKLLFLVRNPYAVAASRTQTGWEYMDNFDDLVKKSSNLQGFLPEQQAFLLSKKLTARQKAFVAWAIENIPPLTRINQPNVQLVFYEDLVLDPKKTMADVMSFIGEKVSPAQLQRMSQPSHTSTGQRRKPEDYLKDWRKNLSAPELKQLDQIAKLFGIDALYPDRLRPDKQAFDALITAGRL